MNKPENNSSKGERTPCGEKKQNRLLVAEDVGVPSGCSRSLEALPAAGDTWPVPSPPSGPVNADGNVLFLFPHVQRQQSLEREHKK